MKRYCEKEIENTKVGDCLNTLHSMFYVSHLQYKFGVSTI